MRGTSRLGSIVVAVGMAGFAVTAPMSADAHTTGIHDNCTNLHKKWPHGVGRKNAHDHTSGTPVKNFFHSTKQYNLAVDHNGTLDADKDGIACEQA